MGSLTGAGTRRFPLKPVSVRVADLGGALSAPTSFLGCALGEAVELDLAGRFGRTAEADIPDSSKMAGDPRKIRPTAAKRTPSESVAFFSDARATKVRE
jgi:hypothetical protein